MEKLNLKKFSKKVDQKDTLRDQSPKHSKSRIAYSILACSIPIFAFLLSSAYSDSKNNSQNQEVTPALPKTSKRAQISNPFQSQTIDNEFSFSQKDKQLELANQVSESQADTAAPKSQGSSSVEAESEAAANADTDAGEDNTPQKVSGPRNHDELTTVLNVTDADIEALIKTFSKLTGRNYVVDSAVKGKITVHLPTPIKISEALKVFDSILLLKGFATVPIGDNIWKVIVAKDAKQTTIPLSGAKNTTDESLVTEIIKSTHVGSEEIQKLVAQFISKDGYSQAIAGTNLLIIVDAASNIERIKDLLKEIDIPPVDQDITIIPVKHAIAAELADKINAILGTDGSDKKAEDISAAAAQIGQSFRRAATLINAANQQNEQNSGGSRTSQIKIIPDDRTNSLIVVADEFTTLKIRALAEQLDSEVDKSSGRFWVYRLEHANAEELSEVLGNLISGSGGSPSSSESSGSSLSRSSNTSSLGLDTGFGGLGGGSGSGGSRRGKSRGRDRSSNKIPGLISDSSKVSFEDEISVAADPSTNSLIVNANRADYEKLSQVIKELDVKRRQVLVEATILEVSLNDEDALGVELQGTAATTQAGFISQTNFGGLTDLLTQPQNLTDLTIAAASAGSLTLPGGLTIPSQAALVSAVSQHSNVNVLSAPTILSTDNQEAEIIVGENVPFVTSTSTNQTNLGNTFNQIQRQDVGITLKITPQLGTGDFLTLQIFVEISNVVDGTRNNANGPTTTVRTTDTMVAVKNKQMIVTGGLIQDSVNDSTRGIPFLEDVPVVGQLFRKNRELKRRTNLLIFLTPQIIQDQFDAREQSKIKANELSEIIDRTESSPNRKEVLENKALDEVLESGSQIKIKNHVPLMGKSHSALDSAMEGDEIIKTVAKTPSNQVKSDTDGVYEFTVLQETSGAKATGLDQNDKLFVVFKSLDKNPLNLTSNDEGNIGLMIPKTADSNKVFITGSQYRLNGANLVCLGVYLNQERAQAMHADILKWNTSDLASKEEFQTAGWTF